MLSSHLRAPLRNPENEEMCLGGRVEGHGGGSKMVCWRLYVKCCMKETKS
jgi:hypothetical protein